MKLTEGENEENEECGGKILFNYYYYYYYYYYYFKINLLHIIYTRCTKISYKIVPATNFTS